MWSRQKNWYFETLFVGPDFDSTSTFDALQTHLHNTYGRQVSELKVQIASTDCK